MLETRETRKRKGRVGVGLVLLIPGLLLLGYIGLWAAGVMSWSLDIGVLFLMVCGGVFTLFGVLFLCGVRFTWLARHRVIRTVLFVALVLFASSFLLLESLIIRGAAHNDADVSADFVLIPGAKIVGDKPSLILQHRLEQAIPYIQSHPKAIVIVSGAKAADEDYSEAEVMKRFLVARGIEESRIIKEEKATNSIGNVGYSEEIIYNYKLDHKPRVMIVTNDFHMFRMRLLARVHGLAAYGISAYVHYSVVPICYCREYFSMMKLLLTGLQED